MDNNQIYTYEDKEEISLVDLLFFCLQRWRILIATMLVGVIIGIGFFLVEKVSADREAAELALQMEAAQNVVKKNQTVDELKESYQISEDVESNMELAYQYRQLYRKQREYNQNSPIMQMNPSAVYSGELEYYISAGYDTGVIALLYQNILSGSGILKELKEAADLEYQEQYIRELIGCTVSRENDSTININRGESIVFKNATVIFVINASTEEACEKMLQVVREKVAILDQGCTENYENYEMMPINDSVNLIANNDFLNRQKSNIDQLNTYRSTMTNLENSFTSDELIYYNRVYLSRDYELENNADNLPTVEMASETEPISLILRIVISILLMCTISGGYFIVKYLSDKKIKTPDDMRNRYHLPVIGIVNTKRNLKGLDGWLDYMRYRKWVTDDTPETIGNMVAAMNEKNLFLCMESPGKKMEEVASRICVCASVIKLLSALNQSGEKIAEVKSSDGIILAVEIGSTTYMEIERELEISQIHQITIHGVIMVL